MKRWGEALSELVVVFALAAVVLTVSALASGVVERAPLSFPIIFLGLGFLIGVRHSLAYLFCTVYHSPCCLCGRSSVGCSTLISSPTRNVPFSITLAQVPPRPFRAPVIP